MRFEIGDLDGQCDCRYFLFLDALADGSLHLLSYSPYRGAAQS